MWEIKSMDIEKEIEKWKGGYVGTWNDVGPLLDALIAEREQAKPKWEPEGGKWYVGSDSITVYEEASERKREQGRHYRTWEQANQAMIFQERAMRFFRWCVEQVPTFKADKLDSFCHLLQSYGLFSRLQNVEDEEVEF